MKILLGAAGAYLLIMILLVRWLFPRRSGRTAVRDCLHRVRTPHGSEFSVGRSLCRECGTVVRWEPNA